MVAPSPDWFTGAADVPLMSDGAWIDTAEIVLWAWDSGTIYTAPNADTQPHQTVRLVASPHFLTAKGLVAVGVARLHRLRP